MKFSSIPSIANLVKWSPKGWNGSHENFPRSIINFSPVLFLIHKKVYIVTFHTHIYTHICHFAFRVETIMAFFRFYFFNSCELPWLFFEKIVKWFPITVLMVFNSELFTKNDYLPSMPSPVYFTYRWRWSKMDSYLSQ